MTKIPVKIVELTSPSGKSAVDVMIDVFDYNEIEDVQEKIQKFKKKYFQIVIDAEKLFFGNDIKKIKKRRSLSSSVYWKLGNMFRKFNDATKNEFTIINYAQALVRDFGLSDRYVRELIIFSKVFKEKEILDSIPMAIYRALIWKKNQLEEINMLEKEKKKLHQRGKSKEFIGRENYKTELVNIIAKQKSKRKPRKKK